MGVSAAGVLGNIDAALAVNPTTQQAALGTSYSYDSRLRPLSETVSGQVGTAGVAASATVNVSGTEQSIAGSGSPAVATGTITFSYSGSDALKKPGPIPFFVGNSITLPDGYHVSFTGSTDSAVLVADALAAVLNTVSSPVTAVVASGGTASSASVTLTTKATGSSQNGSIRLSLSGTRVTAAPASLSGGGGPTYDTGTVTVSVGNTPLTVAYGQSSTAQSVAQGLASAINADSSSLGVTAAAGTDGALTVTASQAGTAGNGIAVTMASATHEPGLFSSASFDGSSGTLSGGTDGSLGPGTIYSYAIPGSGGYAANSNLLSFQDTVIGNWSFTVSGAPCYDHLNRLVCGSASSGPWSTLNMAWSYDNFGNRTAQTPSGTPQAPVPQAQSLSYPSKNQVAGFTYDAAGNVTYDGVNQYAYDAEGRQCAVYNGTPGSYTGYRYDGEGRRVAKGTLDPNKVTLPLTSAACSAANWLAATNNYLVGPSGEQMDELDGSGNPTHSNVYANGQLLATYANSILNWTYAFNDWLGTKRVVANSDGTVAETCLSLPFGDELSCSGSLDPSEQHFTGKERDTESGNDYFGARYFGSSLGRFLSPDWSETPDAVPYADLENPQTLNLYSYGRNNPLVNTDLDGHSENACPSSNDQQHCAKVDNNNYQAAGQQSLQITETVTVTAQSDNYSIGVTNIGSKATIPVVTPPRVSAPNNGEPPSTCLAANIAAVNQVSNLNVNMNNVVGQPFMYNGGLDLNFSVPGGSPSQLPVGRYSSTILGRIFGFGSSLHVPGPGGADPSTYGVDANGNFTFTTHIDSAYATWHTPIGALIHFFTDVRDNGAHRGPC